MQCCSCTRRSKTKILMTRAPPSWIEFDVVTSNPRQRTCFSFFMPQKSFNKPFKFLLYKTNRLHFSVCVYCNRSQKTSKRVKNNSHATRVHTFFRVVLFSSLHAVTLSLIYHSARTRENVIYLLNIILTRLYPMLFNVFSDFFQFIFIK